MSVLRIEEWDRPKREVLVVGWNSTRTACFIRDNLGSRRVIQLELPCQFSITFRENPIPSSLPVQLRSVALHLPPCVTSKEECDALKNPNSEVYLIALMFAPWKLAAHEVLYLEPKHGNALAKLLVQDKTCRRREYVRRKREISHLPTGKAKKQLAVIEDAFRTIAPDNKTISVFDVTLEMVRDGWGGLRDRMLHEIWMKKRGLDADAILDDVNAFRRWLEHNAFNARRDIFDSRTKILERDVSLKLDANQWEALEASVRYEIRFANGDRCWLDGMEERPLINPDEIKEFDDLERINDLEGQEPVALDEARRELGRAGKSISAKWLKELCTGAKIPYPPRNRRELEKVKHYQRRRRKFKAEKCGKLNKERKEERLL